MANYLQTLSQQMGMMSMGEKPPTAPEHAPAAPAHHDTPAPHAGQEGGAVSKVLLLGRERKIIIEGRNRYVTIKGNKVSITKAREMDKKYKAEKKAKAAKAASKSSKSKK